MIADIPSTQQASRLVEHLMNVSEYNLGFGIPSVAASDPSYYSRQPSYFASPDPSYWRGPIWAPTTYLVYKGLLDYGYQDIAINTVAQQWLNTIKNNYVNNSVVFAEYYNSYDGSVNLFGLTEFSWTAAVTLMFAADTSTYIYSKPQDSTSQQRQWSARPAVVQVNSTTTIPQTATPTPTAVPTASPTIKPTPTNPPTISINWNLISIVAVAMLVPVIGVLIIGKQRKGKWL
jgi:glycogen debranching enzyme